MTLQFWRIFFLIILTVQFAAQPASACSPVNGRVYYVVKSGDYLVRILRDFKISKSLWAPEQGYVYKVAELNNIQNPNLVYPGDIIDLPFACEESVSEFEVTQLDRGREVNLKSNRVTASEEKIEPIAQAATAPQTAQATQVERSQAFKAHSRLRASSVFDFHRINSTSSSSQGTATLLSDPSLGLKLSWEQIWSEQFSTEFLVSQAQVKMRDASSGTLLGGNKTLSKIGFGLNYSLNPDLKLKVDSNYGNQLFARAISLGTATLDSVDVSRLGVSVIPTLVRKGDLSLDLQLGYFQVFSTSTTNYSLKTGSGFILAPGVRHKLKAITLELDLKYEELQQDSSISTQENKQTGIHFGLSFEVGK
jgi:hypothetical protein